ncbi:MAG: peptidoglycan-binding protein [Chitinophagaceae bacterium]|nr:peptidoglycan-binding protein [Chitinophagaceae bacterium]
MENKTETILQFLVDQKITKFPLPLNDEYFAYAIAEFQSKKGLTIDGVLGPKTLTYFTPQNIAPNVPTSNLPVSKPSKWLSLIQGTSPSYVKPLVYGLSAFKAIVDAIRTANKPGHFIYITGWMIELDFPLIPNDETTTIYNLLSQQSC